MPLIERSRLTKSGFNKQGQPITILDLSTITDLKTLEDNYEQIIDVLDDELPSDTEFFNNTELQKQLKGHAHYLSIQVRRAFNRRLHTLRFGGQTILEYKKYLKTQYSDQQIRIRLYDDLNTMRGEVIEISFSSQTAQEKFFKDCKLGNTIPRTEIKDTQSLYSVTVLKQDWEKLSEPVSALTPPSAAQRRTSAAMKYNLTTATQSNNINSMTQIEADQKQLAFNVLQESISTKLLKKIDEGLNTSYFSLYRSSDTVKKKNALTNLKNALSEVTYDAQTSAHQKRLNDILNQYEKDPEIISYRIRGFTGTGKARMNNQLNGTEKLLQEIRKMINSTTRKDFGNHHKYNMREDIVHRLAHRAVELNALLNALNEQGIISNESTLITNKSNSLDQLLTTIQQLPQNTTAWEYLKQIEAWENKNATLDNNSNTSNSESGAITNKTLIQQHTGFFQSSNSADHNLLETLKKDLRLQSVINNDARVFLIADAEDRNAEETNRVTNQNK